VKVPSVALILNVLTATIFAFKGMSMSWCLVVLVKGQQGEGKNTTLMLCFLPKIWFSDSPLACISTSNTFRRDYCYDPTDFREGKDLKFVGKNPTSLLNRCEGRCSSDSDCLGNLKCSSGLAVREMGEYADGRDFVVS